MKYKSLITWLLGASVIFGIGYWIYRGVTRPLPGEAITPMGRDHVTDIAGITYNSNPPTSGPHFPVWAKKGVYDRLMSDGYLIHSLEHGYIIISYDCEKPLASRRNLVASAYAHDEPAKDSTDSGQLLKHMKVKQQGNMSWFTPENPPEIEVPLPESFQTAPCKDLVTKLSEFTKVAQRTIVVPRIGMEKPIVLTAWGRILKLDGVDTKLMTDFIKTFHNHGPEQTVE